MVELGLLLLIAFGAFWLFAALIGGLFKLAFGLFGVLFGALGAILGGVLGVFGLGIAALVLLPLALPALGIAGLVWLIAYASRPHPAPVAATRTDPAPR